MSHMIPDYKKIKKIYEGAEAEVWHIKIGNKNFVLKQRKKKRYREELLDKQIIQQRLKKEIKMYDSIKKIKLLGPCAEYYDLDKLEIIMPYFQIPSFRKTIIKEKNKITLLGKDVAKLHNNNIVHGDITLENVLYDPKNKSPVFIDFGLSFISARPEDFATDLFVFKETLLAEFDESYWNLFIKEYELNINKKEVVKLLEKIEKRRKYMS